MDLLFYSKTVHMYVFNTSVPLATNQKRRFYWTPMIDSIENDSLGFCGGEGAGA